MVRKLVQQNSTLMHNISRFGCDPITKDIDKRKLIEGKPCSESFK